MKKLLLALIILAAALYVGGMNDRTPVIVCVMCLLIVFLVSLDILKGNETLHQRRSSRIRPLRYTKIPNPR